MKFIGKIGNAAIDTLASFFGAFIAMVIIMLLIDTTGITIDITWQQSLIDFSD